MRLVIVVGDEGQLDNHYRDGDIFRTEPDDWEPGIKEQQRFLVVEVADAGLDASELESSEYAAGPGIEPVVRRMRKYRLAYAAKLDPEELAAVRDRDTAVPVIVGRFTAEDVIRK